MKTLKEINSSISSIAKSEGTLKATLGTLSRDMLEYVKESGDIDAVNRLMKVLTPKNYEGAKKFFNHHLAYTWETKGGRFGSKSKNKDVVAKKLKELNAFLADGEATIWTWLAEQDNRDPVAKPKEYEKKIEALVKKAIDDKEENIPVSAVIRACIKAGCSLGEIMEALMPDEKKDEQANVKKLAAA